MRRIVVVDDNRDLLYTIRVYFAAHGHTVWAEAGGPAGIRRIAAERPDIAFCDLHLPRVNGYQVATAIRRDKALAEVRLIAMTADSDSACPTRAQAAGFETTLVKPVPLEEMLRLVEMALPLLDRDSGLPIRHPEAFYAEPDSPSRILSSAAKSTGFTK